MSLADYIARVPKVELHVHLEGSVLPETLLKLALRNGIVPPEQKLETLRTWFTYRDFAHFVELFLLSTNCLRTAEDYELITYEFGATMARQNVRYAEVTFSSCTHHYTLGRSHEMFFNGIQRGRARARADFNVEIRWVFDIVRDIADTTLRRKRADYTTALAIEYRDEGVVALGLGGAEADYPPEQFAPWFTKARAAGLHSAPHAGEMAGPASVRGALQILGAERIGHGVRSIEDPELLSLLAEQHIPLEVCPTSNIRLGVYPTMHMHPLPHLIDAGVPITVNSDDPPLFNTTLNDELALLVEPFHYDLKTIDEIVLNGARHSFLPPAEKATLLTQMQTEMARLKQELALSAS